MKATKTTVRKMTLTCNCGKTYDVEPNNVMLFNTVSYNRVSPNEGYCNGGETYLYFRRPFRKGFKALLCEGCGKEFTLAL